MAKPSFSLLLVLCHVLFLNHSAQAQDHIPQPDECPEEFPCGSLGVTRFPLTRSSRPDCGLLKVDCEVVPYPRIEYGGTRYDAKMQYESYLLLLVPKVQTLLENKTCQFLEHISFPNSLSITYIRTPQLTMFRCNNSLVSKTTDQFPGYQSYGCKDFSVHYRDPYTNSSQDQVTTTGDNLPPNCATIPLPIQDDDTNAAGQLFRTLTSEFYLTWSLSANCTECHYKFGGQCVTEKETNEFNCLAYKGFPAAKGKLKHQTVIIIAACVGGFAISVILLLYFRRKHICGHIQSLIRRFRTKTNNEQKLENLLATYGSLAPKRYSYSEVKKMTESFKNKLGQGGYGSVYKGKLHDGSAVAVKVLKDLKDGGEEFINEIASISRTSHVNIVALKGFCFEDQKKALIYEFMCNGSLEKFIYEDKSSTGRQLEWKVLYRIAIGIARGLEYLHRGCKTRILHFDIKPHNILLDEDFCPKISDFGLAKLCTNKESVVSVFGARGTIGYIAPEVVCRSVGGVSYKSDVYSYGMMVLEMVAGRKNTDIGVSRPSEIYFPQWIHSRLELAEALELNGITSEEENEYARKMIIVSLWCIQVDPTIRPTMSRAVEMLEGNLSNLETPPKPYFSSFSISEVDQDRTSMDDKRSSAWPLVVNLGTHNKSRTFDLIQAAYHLCPTAGLSL